MSSGNIVTKRLSTGQTINLTAHEEKLLRQAYEYLAGYAKRQHFRNTIATKNKDFSGLGKSSSFANLDILLNDCSFQCN